MEDHIDRCPYCLNPVKFRAQQDMVRSLTPRQYCIYMAIVEAGPNGKSSKELLETFLAGRQVGTLRTAIFGINSKISPMCLRSRAGRYYLSRVNWSEEPIKEE